jgi:Zn-dependent metalloprotease
MVLSGPWAVLLSGQERPLQPGVESALLGLERQAGAPLIVARSPVTGAATFVAPRFGAGIEVSGAGWDPESRARAFLEANAAAFGVAAADLRLAESRPRDPLGMDHVRFVQVHDGVPVTGAEVLVHLRGERVVAVNGRTLPGLKGLDVTPSLDPARAAAEARDRLSKHHGQADATLGEPRLEVLNRGLLENRASTTRLAWFVEATAEGLRRFVWVDARNGGALLDFSQLTDARNRQVHTANSSSILPGALVRSEGGPATGDVDTDAAYDYMGHAYDYFLAQHGRDGFDAVGSPLVATVHYCPSTTSCPYANAFWNGWQLVFGDGYSRADDVTVHEWTHGVTERTARLFYYMQSGALNESFSDVFGEVVDLGNGAGNDTAGVRWLVGEDVPGTGAVRHMMDPTAYGDPGKMSDPQFVCQDPGTDGGGVHTNSGVPNHAFALAVDGGTYNGVTVTGIGQAKAGAIWYRTLSQYLLPASDFLDAYQVLPQACADLVGTGGITAADCLQVRNALDAVQMSSPWPCVPAQGASPSLCPAGQMPVSLLADDLEDTAPGRWTTRASGAVNHWNGGQGASGLFWDVFATSGLLHFWGFNYSAAGESSVDMAAGTALPAAARLQFNHAYGFENSGATYYDGGVIERSTDGGASWADAGPLIAAGAAYGGTIASAFGNPLAGRSAFVRESWGYTASQLDLSSLAGQTVRFRFRVGTDTSVSDLGWFVDDVRLYTCSAVAQPTLLLEDRAVLEGNAGGRDGRFTVSLHGAPAGVVSVAYATGGGTATPNLDYAPAAGTLNFPLGTTTQTIHVSVRGDVIEEGEETFFVSLSNPAGAVLARPQATGRIVDDELCGRSFAPAPTVSLPEGALAVASADFNNDNRADLAVGMTNGLLRVALGVGDGTFTSPTAYSSGGTSVTSVVAADFNRDGSVDLAATHYNFGSGTRVARLLGLGDGTFGPPALFTVGAAPFFLAAGDFNVDANADLAVTSGGSSVVSVLLGTGTGDFGSAVAYPVAGNPRAIAVADVSGDGRTDLAVACQNGNNVALLLGNGAGGFSPAPSIPLGTSPSFVAAGDLDGDGDNDLGVATYGGALAVLLGRGNATFDPPAFLAAGSEPYHLVLRDFDRDGRLDAPVVARGSSALVHLRGRGDGSFLSPLSSPVGSDPRYLAVNDFNGDGRPDLAVASWAANNVSVLLNQVPTVSISGPATFCQGASPLYDAGPGYDTYAWILDGGLVSTSRTVTPIGLSPGSHALAVEVGSAACGARSDATLAVLPLLSAVGNTVAGSTTVCTHCTGGTATATATGGGTVAFQWGYRTTSGGPVTSLPGRTGSQYVLQGQDFPGPGGYLLVATVTPACGDAMVSNEVAVTIVDLIFADGFES